MKLKKQFKQVCNFPDYYVDCSDKVTEAEWEVKRFNDEYECFKKNHNLENLYFSRVIRVEAITSQITEVYYEITDLYLTYLQANNCLPQGAIVETHIIKETYLFNTQKEWMFRDSMLAAVEQQDACLKESNYSVRSSSMFEGVTERIKLSNPSNGLPGMIVDRIPMVYDELIDASTK